MALYAEAATYPCGPLGNAAFSSDTESRSLSCSGHLLFDHSQPWDAYIFHGVLTHPILVRIYRPRQRVRGNSYARGDVSELINEPG